jgi:hypothetical protein
VLGEYRRVFECIKEGYVQGVCEDVAGPRPGRAPPGLFCEWKEEGTGSCMPVLQMDPASTGVGVRGLASCIHQQMGELARPDKSGCASVSVGPLRFRLVTVPLTLGAFAGAIKLFDMQVAEQKRVVLTIEGRGWWEHNLGLVHCVQCT